MIGSHYWLGGSLWDIAWSKAHNNFVTASLHKLALDLANTGCSHFIVELALSSTLTPLVCKAIDED